MALTAQQLNFYRTTVQDSAWYLAMDQPRVLLTGEVDTVSGLGALTFDYIAGTPGDIDAIEDGHTLVVTTSYKDYEVRVTGHTTADGGLTGTLTVAANGIPWASGQEFVIYEEYHLWSEVNRIYPKSSAGVFYKDYNVAYSDQNETFKPLVLFDHQVLWLENGAASVTIDLGQSNPRGSAIASSALAASPSGGLTITDNGDDTYTIDADTDAAGGQYWLKGTVTLDNGKSRTSVRRLFVFDNDNQPFVTVDANKLIVNENGASLQASVHAGGATIRERGLALLFCRQQNGLSEVDPIEIVCDGYIITGSVSYNWAAGEVAIQIETLNKELASRLINDISLEAVANPSYWYQYITGMTTAKAVLHILEEHSNVAQIANLRGFDTDTLQRRYAETSRGTLLAQAQQLARQRLSNLACTRRGDVVWSPGLQYLDLDERNSYSTTMAITDADINGEVVIQTQPAGAATVLVKALAFDGASISAYCAVASAVDVLEQEANAVEETQVTVSSQADANMLAGRIFAARNNKYYRVQMSFANYYWKLFDPVEPTWFTFSMAATDNPRGLVWTNRRMFPVEARVDFSTLGGVNTTITFETEALGADGYAVDCNSGANLSGWGQDSQRSDEPSWESGPSALVTAGSGGVAIRVDGTGADWEQRNGDESPIPSTSTMALDPFWPGIGKSFSRNALKAWLIKAVGDPAIAATGDAGGVWNYLAYTPVVPNTWEDATAPTFADLTPVRAVANPLVENEYVVLFTWQSGSNYRSFALYTADLFVTYSWAQLYDGTRPTSLQVLDAEFDFEDGLTLWVTVDKDGTLYLDKWDMASWTKSSTSLGAVTDVEVAYVCAPIGDADLIYIHGNMDSPAGLTGRHHVIKSTNSGSTWSAVENGWGNTAVCKTFDVDADGVMYAVRSG